MMGGKIGVCGTIGQAVLIIVNLIFAVSIQQLTTAGKMAKE